MLKMKYEKNRLLVFIIYEYNLYQRLKDNYRNWMLEISRRYLIWIINFKRLN